MDNRDLWEKEMEEMIRNTGEKLSVPESLQPETIKQNLLEKKSARIKRSRQIRRWCAAAAMFLLVCGCGVAWTVSGGKPVFMGGGVAKENHTATNKKTAKSEMTAFSEDSTNDQDTEVEEEKLTYAKDYQEIWTALQEIAKRNGYQRYGIKDKGILLQENVAEENYDSSQGSGSALNFLSSDEETASAGVSKSKSTSEDASSASHSETNVSVEGIMEADQVSTDGEYIYRLRQKVDGTACLDIVKADGGKMELTGKYACGDDDLRPREFFLAGDQLILLSVTYRQEKCNTCITFLDISDRSKPVKTHELTQTGSYFQARLQDGYLYTVSGNSTYLYKDYEWLEDEDCLPEGVDDPEGQIPCLNGKRILASQIYIPDGCNETAFTTITSVKLDDPHDFTDSRSIMSSANSMHMTEENIYFTTDKWMDSSKKKSVLTKRALTKTQLTKFTYHKGKFTGKATKQIKGSIRDTFAINEYQGNLRIISSISYNKGKDDNAVYVLDKDLEIIGKIEHLAKDERVYSARFQGDIGYFVTYRETDPLFSVDFSDPRNPKILGELKIPGFSEYMHFYNDHLLFGIGIEELDGSEDDEWEALKLSMFDISDPTNVKEIHKTLLKNIYYSEALEDYKSVLIDPEKNIIGFDGYGDYMDDDLQYYVYSYDEEKGFVRKMNAKIKDADTEFIRGVYIEDTVYVVNLGSKSIKAYDWNSGKCIGTYPKK